METNSSQAQPLRNRGFKVVEALKGSGHATIFRVRESEDPGCQAYVAKVVSLMGLDAKGRAGAQQEVSLLKGLAAHPNLIAYRESFLEEAGILYIVMSLAEDGDLRRVVIEKQAAKRALPEPVVLTWLSQTLSGLKHLHGQSVVHRDLKSSNIFLCDRRRRIRIGDFGISRVLESTDWASSCVGTPAYMSPELMRNERYDYHVDMWALGCIIFELCTLKLPFPARSLLDLAYEVLETEPTWAVWSDGYTEELRGVARRLLSKEREKRPTAAQVSAEPLFAEGGRGAQPAPEEAWAEVTPRSSEAQTPEKRAGPRETSLSDRSTAAAGDSSGGWTMTPRMPWEVSSRGSDSVAGASPGGLGSMTGSETAAATLAQEMQRTQAAQHTSTKEEISELLTTLSSSANLQAAVGGKQAGQAPTRQVVESVL